MRQAEIYYNNLLAGVLTETDGGEYTFLYDANYAAIILLYFQTLPLFII